MRQRKVVDVLQQGIVALFVLQITWCTFVSMATVVTHRLYTTSIMAASKPSGGSCMVVCRLHVMPARSLYKIEIIQQKTDNNTF
jgi:hypothetical protein